MNCERCDDTRKVVKHMRGKADEVIVVFARCAKCYKEPPLVPSPATDRVIRQCYAAVCK